MPVGQPGGAPGATQAESERSSQPASYVVIALIGWAAFGEVLNTQKLLAIALICGGVVLLATTA